MVEIVFTEELRGKAVPVEGKENTFHAHTSGRGARGEDVSFESDVVMTGADSFDEVGSITFAGRGTLKFETIGSGHIGPSPNQGINHGSVLWRVTEGDGEFQGVSGMITSNFTFSEQGDVVDNHYVRIYIP